MSESWEELSLVSASPKSIRKGLESVVMKHVAKATKPQKGTSPSVLFYQSSLTPEVVHRAESLALDICIEVQGFLHTTHPDMPLGEMSLGGSLLDDLQVVRADHACLLVPLQLEPSLWRLIPGEETLLTHPLHWMVRRVNLEYFPRGRSYWDSIQEGYLNLIYPDQYPGGVFKSDLP
uniref:Mitochondrial dynamics protein MID51-like C-terminal domain-containing protein n=1 Tax=Salmo trutta TaxID=8032 RepID=A0A674A6K8_SALTR